MILMELVKLRLRYSLRDGTNWRDIFNAFDDDNSGSLDYRQFTQVIRKGGGLSQDKLPDKDLRNVFEQVDLAAARIIAAEAEAVARHQTAEEAEAARHQTAEEAAAARRPREAEAAAAYRLRLCIVKVRPTKR